MSVIKKSAEHEFLSCLERLKDKTKGWVCAHFGSSKKEFNPKAARVLAQINTANQGLESADALASKIEEATRNIDERFIFRFADGDVVFLGHLKPDKDLSSVKEAMGFLSQHDGVLHFDFGILDRDFHSYKKLGREKMMSAAMHETYGKMADTSRVSSISARRRFRDDPVVLMIEDDRFSGAYAANILMTDYDMVLCRTGEEGISAYIDHAPDVVFIDIHLPGISGHQTLEAIKEIDPEAFVIMLSVDAVKGNIVQASKNGAKNFLKKPFSKERLKAAVRTSPFVRGEEHVKPVYVAETTIESAQQ